MLQHNSYPHTPGLLYDCKVCESQCFCGPDGDEPCVYHDLMQESEDMSNTISESNALQRYDEMLDEIHEGVKCGELEWEMSRVLKEMDPTAYQCGFNDWLDSEGLELE